MKDFNQESLEAAVSEFEVPVRFLTETDSTNRVAAEWAEQGGAELSLVVADHQSAGRGRMGRAWLSPPGASLLVSVILRPQIPSSEAARISLAAGVAVCEAAKAEGLDARLKWPNDVLIGGKKVSGTLAESRVALGLVSVAVLGIGVNVNLPEGELPREVAGSATSFSIEAGKEIDRLRVLTTLLRSFVPRYRTLKIGDSVELMDDYRSWCDTIGRHVRIDLGSRVVESRAVGVDDHGALILESGEVVGAGDVVHLR